MAEKTALQKLSEKILIQREPAKKTYPDKEVEPFVDSYKTFLSSHKTEREAVAYAKAQAEKAGFADLRKQASIKKGGTYYYDNGEKNLALIRFSGLASMHAVVSHADCPCLHLKPYPLAESQKLAVFKTHYYGGIKKYQWLNIPLALHGVAYTKQGKRVDFALGEKEDDPVFTIPDLLPHLAREQLEKKASKVVEGEQLNVIMGTDQVDDENITEKAKLAIAKKLNDEYGLVEEDLISAELSFVPAGKARDAALDRSLVVGYGQDDRSSVYTSLRAMLDTADASFTQIVAFYDKEEIGSYGKTGAGNQFFTSLIEELIDRSQSDLRPTQVWSASRILSADVTSALDPNFPDAHDLTNASSLGYGVAIEKYGGGGGKYSTSDADAEYTHALLSLFSEHKVPWQTGENGKIDLGGGGTVAMFFARNGADVIDIGVPVLGMHAPTEVAHKTDLYSAYQAFRTFLKHPLPKR